MKIIFASKFYYRRGGLEAYMFKAIDILEQSGHTVIPFSTNHPDNIDTPHNKYFCDYIDLSNIDFSNLRLNAKAIRNMLHNTQAHDNMLKLCKETKPNIVQGFGVTKHLSSSIFKAAKESGASTLMRLSDFALMCPSSLGIDGSGHLCHDLKCSKNNNMHCIKSRCVNHSLAASIVGFLEVKCNTIYKNYLKSVDHWIAPSKFIKNKFIDYYHIPEHKITHLPIFIDAVNIKPSNTNEGYILYAGRISKEKGIYTLINAIAEMKHIHLKIAGIGPDLDNVLNIINNDKLNVEYIGFQSYADLQESIRKSSLVVVPSECFENSPNIVLESYSLGKPVVASDIGGIPELVKDGEIGFLCEPGNYTDLIEKLDNTITNASRLGKNARDYLDSNFTKQKHLDKLLSIYNNTLR